MERPDLERLAQRSSVATDRVAPVSERDHVRVALDRWPAVRDPHAALCDLMQQLATRVEQRQEDDAFMSSAFDR